MLPGCSLRQARESLGLTYRDVERASYEVASQHGRPEFVIHISRLADIENASVTPGVHKIYSLCAIYHLDPIEVCRWYNVPLDELFRDGARFLAPKTHPAAPPRIINLPLRFDPAFDPKRTEYLTRMVERWEHFEGAMLNGNGHDRYGYVGLEDHWMEPLLRPGCLVLIDPAQREIQDGGWQNEYERPIYFVDVRHSYRCCWCVREQTRLYLQPHPLSPCTPEAFKIPDEVEVVGRVVRVAMRLVPS